MAVIQKIRDKYAKVAGFIIALALVGFILSDALNGRIGNFFGPQTSVVTVNGEEVDQREYMQRVEDYETIYELYGGGRSLDDVLKAQLHDQALRELIVARIIDGQMETLGITVSKEEENDIIKGANLDPMVRQFPYFQDPRTGTFDMNALLAFEGRNLDMSNPNAARALQQWEIVKAFVKRNYRLQKFNNMVVNGVYQPKFTLESQSKDQLAKASIRYVKIPFSMVDDNDPAVNVTEADLQAYLKKRAAQYTIYEPTRSIEYVLFNVVPSTEDTAQVLNDLATVKNEFAGATDMEVFVGRNSDEQYVDMYQTRETFFSAHADSIFSLSTGSVYGPYFENGAYRVTKVVERRSLPDTVKCRHILVRTGQQGQEVLSDSLAKLRIDSVQQALKGGADFAQLVLQYSEDEGSKENGGEYEFTLAQRAQLSKEFGDFIFEGKAGEKKVVKVENNSYAGYHYIEILSQSAAKPALKLATVVKTFAPSQNTHQEVYARASEFAGRNTNPKAFDEGVKEMGLSKRVAANIKPNDFIIDGIGPSREVIRWVYEAKKGEISAILSLDNSYLVAKLTDIQEKGLAKPDANMRPMLEASVRAEKKAKVLKEKYKNVTSLDALSQTTGLPVQPVDSFNAGSTYLPYLGAEPKVVGYAFYSGFKPNTVSPAIQGQDGIFFISLTYREEAPATAASDPMVLGQQAMFMQMQLKNTISGGLLEVLKRKAEVEYNPALLY